MELLQHGALLVATVTMGLIAGLLYGYACSVMPGLRQTDDRTFIEVMRKINIAIINPWFMLSFIGAWLFTALALILHTTEDGRPALGWIIAALVLYTAAVAITARINVPLNNELARVNNDPVEGVRYARERFEAKWARWNIVRAVAATLALACLAWALVVQGGHI